MEQATNMFNKGMQLDTHPMTQSNDTLTDCLNGTLITQNGNEVILQNDMGNRRVDNAFLPAGYQPVGMKEYGGIIYVAAYNPITNKSQIGSFPSPQKKFNNIENGKGVGLDFGEFFANTFTFEEKFSKISENFLLKFIKSDNILIPLIEDVNMYPGDKFVVYCNSLNSNEISNFNNTKEGKIISPKNKQYTLSLGVLNSQNEFVDITSSLNRWTYDEGNDDSKIIKYPDNTSKEYKFNDGYFIAKNFTNPNLEETIEDTKFIKNRQALPVNTYSFKLVGPLYLKAQINHVENFDYNITGNRISNTEYDLFIDGFFTYNCPDTTNQIDENNIPLTDNLYLTYDEITPDLDGFCFYSSANITKVTSSECSKSIYDRTYNTYKLKISKIIHISTQDTILNYLLTVPVKFNEKEYHNYFLRGLTSEGSLDLSLLNSGSYKLTGWRFYNNVEAENTEIKYSFELYPKINHQFKNLTITIKNKTLGNLSVSSSGHIVINWKDFELNKQQVYSVLLQCDDVDIITNKVVSTITLADDLWILTTELFNSCYIEGSSDYIQNYIKPTNNSEKATFDRKVTVKLDIDGVLQDNSVTTSRNEGSVFGIDNDEIKYSEIKTTNLDLVSSDSKVKIKNEEYYPTYVLERLSQAVISPQIQGSNINEIQMINDHNNGISDHDENKDYFISLNGNTLTVKYELRANGYKQQTIRDMFVPVSEAIKNMLKYNEELAAKCLRQNNDQNASEGYNYPYFGFTLMSDYHAGGYYTKYVVLKRTVTPFHKHWDHGDPDDEFDESLGTSISGNWNDIQKSVCCRCGVTDHDCTNKIFWYIISKDKDIQDLNISKSSYNKWYIRYDGSGEDENSDRARPVGDPLRLVSCPIIPMLNNNTYYLDKCQNLSFLFKNSTESIHDHIYQSTTNTVKSYTKDVTILWWKCSDNLWAASKYLIPKHLIYNNNDKLNTNFEELAKAIFGEDFYFCHYSNYYNNSMYFPQGGTVKVSHFNKDLVLNINLNISGILENTNEDRIGFKIQSSNNELFEYTIKISENNSFYDHAERLNSGIDYSSIDIKGRNRDSEGNILSVNSVYIEKNGVLVKVKKNPFEVNNVDTYTRENNTCRQIVIKNNENLSYGPVSKQKNDVLILNNNDIQLLYFYNLPLIPRLDNE